MQLGDLKKEVMDELLRVIFNEIPVYDYGDCIIATIDVESLRSKLIKEVYDDGTDVQDSF